MAVSHITVNLGLGYQCGYGVHYDNVNGSGAYHGLRDLQCLLTVIRLGNVQVVNIYADVLRIDRIQSMLSIDESGNTASFLYFCDHM